MLRLDTDAKITYVNKRYQDMLGYSAEELIGRSILEFMDDESRVLARQKLDRRSQGVTESFDHRFRHKDGSAVWGIVSASPIYDDDGRPAGFFRLVPAP